MKGQTHQHTKHPNKVQYSDTPTHSLIDIVRNVVVQYRITGVTIKLTNKQINAINSLIGLSFTLHSTHWPITN